MAEYITIPFYKGRAIEDELKVHQSLKEAKKYANQYLNTHEEGYTIEITQF